MSIDWYLPMPEGCSWCGKTDKLELVGPYGWLCEDCADSVDMNEKTAEMDEGSVDF